MRCCSVARAARTPSDLGDPRSVPAGGTDEGPGGEVKHPHQPPRRGVSVSGKQSHFPHFSNSKNPVSFVGEVGGGERGCLWGVGGVLTASGDHPALPSCPGAGASPSRCPHRALGCAVAQRALPAGAPVRWRTGESGRRGQGCIGRGGAPPPLQSAQPMPSYCLFDGKCQPQWHL